MAVDIKGVFLAVTQELEYMVANGVGTVVNTASAADLIADPNIAPYVTAKHAVTDLAKAAALTTLKMVFAQTLLHSVC